VLFAKSAVKNLFSFRVIAMREVMRLCSRDHREVATDDDSVGHPLLETNTN